MICIYPNCTNNAQAHVDVTVWCHTHYGLFPHKCEHSGCDSIVSYDDEPYCFTHSPDSGSSVRGYSAYANHTKNNVTTNNEITSIDDLINILLDMNVKRFECRDLTFSDAELFYETPDGNQIGGGYIGRGSTTWFEINGITYNYKDDDAHAIRSRIPVATITRNDNEGVW